MKKVLLNIFGHAVAKNVFTPGFKGVLEKTDGVQFIVVVPEQKVEEFKHELALPHLEVIGRPQRFASFAENAALFLARNSIPTHAVRQLQEDGFDGSGRIALPKYVLALITWAFAHAYLYRAFLKMILPAFFDTSMFESVIEKYKPDLVFATTIYAVDDLRLLGAARRKGVKTLGMIKSWDNLTSKDFLLIAPDYLIVHNDIVKEEAIQLHNYPAEKIFSVGVPQFDWYANSPRETRSEFCSRLGLDPNKKIVTYSAMGRWYVHHERDIIQTLAEIVRGGTLPAPAQLFVRLHPAYPDDVAELQVRMPSVVFDQPGTALGSGKGLWKVDWKFSVTDQEHLASVVRWSDVVVNCGSTMLLDAACFDTPVIGIAFDGSYSGESYWKSARRMFNREHCLPLVRSGGVAIANDREELISALRRYLSNRATDHEGRVRIVREQTLALDGKAGERMAHALLAVLSY